ncbi:MAG: hypothetical protein [Caudoviricetes sp.]|nr:MAG: hypothetical protein [Caudoviricetes sp.]
MAYVTTSWARPVQGVSQQPDRIRQEGQCTLQENFLPDLVKGLTKRPSTRFIASLFSGSLNPLNKYHSYDRGDEAYFMYIAPNSNTLEVYGIDGRKHIVTGADTYINTPDPYRNLDMKTIGDYTFITNKTVNVLMSSEKSPSNTNDGIVYLQYATYGRTYAISVNGTDIATYVTPDGSDASQSPKIDTSYIMNDLYLQIHGSTTPPYPAQTAYVVELHDNVMFIKKADGSDFTLTTRDGAKGDDMIAIKDSVTSVSQLPPFAPNGTVLRITGEGKSTKDDYWLKAVTGSSKIRWVETVEPNIPIKFDASTMPHTLVRDTIDGSGIATFVLQESPWNEREVGGEDSNPLPDFIDVDNPLPINATGVFQNRLFFLSGEAWVAGRSGFFFNFWKETSQSSTDSDPISGYADTDRVNNLYQYQILDGDLALFSDGAQLAIRGDQPVKSDNLTLEQVTAYPNNQHIQPQAGGENIFFAYDMSGYTGIREMFTDNYTDTKKAQPVTDYVNKYLVGNCIQMLTSPNFNTMMVRTDNNRNVVYVYDWLWQNQQKVQSAWHTWSFDSEINYLFYIEDDMYILNTHNGTVGLDVLKMVNDPDDAGLSFSICADHKVSVTATYDPDAGTYSFVAPYDTDNLVATISTGGRLTDIGSSIQLTKSGRTYTTNDNLADKANCQVLIGTRYNSRYIPTKPTVKDARERVIGLDKIIVSNLYINYEETGYIKVTATDKYGATRSYQFFGRIMNTGDNLIGSPVIGDGSFRAPIRKRADDMVVTIESDSHFPLTIRDLEMNGQFHQRGQRI